LFDQFVESVQFVMSEILSIFGAKSC
jgi:hypothetical protein